MTRANNNNSSRTPAVASLWRTTKEDPKRDEYRLDEDFYDAACRALDSTDKTVIRERLIKYTEIIELINARCATERYEIADWALAMAMAPDWYGDKLAQRLQNSMLVSALLLTVSAEMFISPPLADDDITRETMENVSYRVTAYLSAICNVVLLLSIIMGVWFIENAMSRSYGDSERFILIMKYYSIKDASQVFSVVGSALFPVLLCAPSFELYVDGDAYFFVFLTGVAVVSSLAIVGYSTTGSSYEQTRRLAIFKRMIDENNGCRLLPQYYPDDADFQPEDYQRMFRKYFDEADMPSSTTAGQARVE